MKCNLNINDKHWKLKVSFSAALYVIAFAGALRTCCVFYQIGPFVAYTRIIKTLLMVPLPMLAATIIMYKLSADHITKEKTIDLCWWYLFVVYSIILGFILLGGGRRDYDYSHMLPNFIPFASLSKDIASAMGINNGRIDLRCLFDLAGNVALFVPLAFLLPYKIKRKRKLILLCSILMPTIVMIEILQQVLAAGVFDIDDIVLNSLGIPLGLLLYSAVKRIRMSHQRMQNN